MTHCSCQGSFPWCSCLRLRSVLVNYSSCMLLQIILINEVIDLRGDCSSRSAQFITTAFKILSSDTWISISINPHQRSFPLQKIETITENQSWLWHSEESRRLWEPQHQWKLGQHNSYIYALGNISEEGQKTLRAKVLGRLLWNCLS